MASKISHNIPREAEVRIVNGEAWHDTRETTNRAEELREGNKLEGVQGCFCNTTFGKSQLW